MKTEAQVTEVHPVFAGAELVGPEVQNIICKLRDAHADYDNAGNINKERLVELDTQIKTLSKERSNLKGESDNEMSLQSSIRHSYAGRVGLLLKDPGSNIHPIYRAVLIAATMEQGSLWYPHSFEAADQLGAQLAIMQDALTSAPDTQPAISIVQRESSIEVIDTRIDAGITEPNTGMDLHIETKKAGTCGCGQTFHTKVPHLAIPIIGPTTFSVEPDLRRPLYRRSDGRIVRYNGKTPTEEVVSKIDIKPASPRITLPTGTLWNEKHLIAFFDTPEGVKQVVGARKFLSDDATVTAVGERAVKKLLEKYRNDADKDMKNPFMHYDIASFVASSLGLTLRKKKK